MRQGARVPSNTGELTEPTKGKCRFRLPAVCTIKREVLMRAVACDNEDTWRERM